MAAWPEGIEVSPERWLGLLNTSSMKHSTGKNTHAVSGNL